MKVYTNEVNTLVTILKEEEYLTDKFFHEFREIINFLENYNGKLKVLDKSEFCLNERVEHSIQNAKKLQESVNLRKLEQTELENLKKKLEDLIKKKNELINKKLDNPKHHKIEKCKNALRACQILTSTHFDFSSKINGYVINKDFRYKAFELSPKTMSRKKITEYLWKNLSQLSTVCSYVPIKNS